MPDQPELAVVATSISFATAAAVAVPPDPGERPALLYWCCSSRPLRASTAAARYGSC
ncbi:MAG: hypothetical protein ACR2K2_15775 [Mycobacteriales bacterium]